MRSSQVKFDNSSLSNVQGTLTFDDLTSFLTGKFPASSGNLNITGGDLSYGLRERWYSAFVGDTWRITPRLTLTPSLRYEYMGPPHEVENHLGTFDPTVAGGLAVVGPGLPHSKLFNPQKANSCRALAWRGTSGATVRPCSALESASYPASPP